MKKPIAYVLSLMCLTAIVSCSKDPLPTPKQPLEQLTTPNTQKITTTPNYRMSQQTYDSYMGFAKKFTMLAMEKNIGEGEESLGVSIPDAYLCLAVLGTISADAAQQDVLNFLGLPNMGAMRVAAKEILSTLCTLYEDNDGKYHGGYNLNSIWLNPDKVKLIEEKDEQLYKDLEEVFDASTYLEPLTTQKANQYLKDYGLKDQPIPEIELNDEDPSALNVMSVFYCLDFFHERAQEYYKTQFESGTHKMEYHSPNGDTQVDYINSQGYREVYEGDDFFGSYLDIGRLKMAAFLPKEQDMMPSNIIEDVLDEDYDAKSYEVDLFGDGVLRETTKYDVNIKAPYFSLDNKIVMGREELSKVMPIITSTGAGERLATSDTGNLYLDCLSQFSVMRFNYDGFYSCSVTIADIEAGALPPAYEQFDLSLDHPYVFEIRKNVTVGENNLKPIPMVVGEIVTPNYAE